MYAFMRGGTMMLLIGDLITFALSLILTLLVRYQEIPEKEILREHLGVFAFLFVIWVLVYLIAGLYDRDILLGRKHIPSLVLRVQFINILIAGVFFFLFPVGIAPKTNLIIYLFISAGLIVFWRLFIFPRIVGRKLIRVLIVGSSAEAIEIAEELASNPYFKSLEVFLLSRQDAYDFTTFRNSMLSFVEGEGVKIIVADTKDEYASLLIKDFYMLAFENRNIRFFNLQDVYERLLHRVPTSLVEEAWLLEHVTTESPHYAYDALKRTLDVVLSAMLLIPYAAIFPFVALAIKLEDRGPLFYKAERVGQNNTVISIFKFRTLTGSDSSDAALKSELVPTKVGTFLRKTRIDELPQLINILKGDLSFIGPRPEIPTLAHVYAENIPYYNTRHLIKPGLSGWAQINNYDAPRGGVDIPRTIDKLSFDFYYLKRRSLLLDMEIALKTINTLFLRTGT